MPCWLIYRTFINRCSSVSIPEQKTFQQNVVAQPAVAPEVASEVAQPVVAPEVASEVAQPVVAPEVASEVAPLNQHNEALQSNTTSNTQNPPVNTSVNPQSHVNDPPTTTGGGKKKRGRPKVVKSNKVNL
jgi:hypothetical protein